MRSTFLILLGLLLCISANPALAEKRIALVIGMSRYQQVPRLANPVRDADAISALLKMAGFDVVDGERDLGISDLRRVVRELAETARDADIAVVYFAGHGIELDGTNYLVPVDAKLLSDFDVEDETVSLDRVLKALAPVRRLKLVILDACRFNPFSKTMERSLASRSVERGLAKVDPATPDTLVAFAAKAGAVASDGNGQNSPFATALVKYITQPGLDLRLAFGRVRDDVLKSTGNHQEPFVYGSLGGETMALVPQVAKPADPEAEARVHYEFAAQIGTMEAWDLFVSTYPEGFYAKLALAQRNKLAAEATQAEADKAKKMANQAKAAEAAKSAAAKPGDDHAVGPVAALPPADDAAATTAEPARPSSAEVAHLLQDELRRVGCNTAAIDDDWNAAAQKSLALFNRYSGTNLDIRVASRDALDTVKSKTVRICPLTCDHGYRPDGERCVRITCGSGFFLNDDDECERKRERPLAMREESPAAANRPKHEPLPKSSPTAQASGQILCNSVGCRPVQKGCQIMHGLGPSNRQIGQDLEICS
jgi:uncharacterized caspase-like protein